MTLTRRLWRNNCSWIESLSEESSVGSRPDSLTHHRRRWVWFPSSRAISYGCDRMLEWNGDGVRWAAYGRRPCLGSAMHNISWRGKGVAHSVSDAVWCVGRRFPSETVASNSLMTICLYTWGQRTLPLPGICENHHKRSGSQGEGAEIAPISHNASPLANLTPFFPSLRYLSRFERWGELGTDESPL